jgi:hypothetical protein
MSSNHVGHLITCTIITLQHFATLHHTSPNYTSLQLSTLSFLSFTLHSSQIWLNPPTFPIFLFHLTQYGSHINKLLSTVMNPFNALKDLSPFHFTSVFIFILFFSLILSTPHFTLLCYSHLQLTPLHVPCLKFLLFIAFTSPTVLYFPNPRFENTSMSFTVGSPDRPIR